MPSLVCEGRSNADSSNIHEIFIGILELVSDHFEFVCRKIWQATSHLDGDL